MCTETLKGVFSNAKKKASRNIFWHYFRASSFMFVLLISNHTVFLVQFEIKRVFKNSHGQINSKLNSKGYDYLYL